MTEKEIFQFYNKVAASVMDLDNIAYMLEKGKTESATELLKKRADILRELCDDFRARAKY